KAHGGKELLLRTPRPIRRQLKSVTNLVLGVISAHSKCHKFRIGNTEVIQNRFCEIALSSLAFKNPHNREPSNSMKS
ncbi:MAG: hypothetical protein WAK48_20160, partial [Candidatus Acidiferrum sp.]